MQEKKKRITEWVLRKGNFAINSFQVQVNLTLKRCVKTISAYDQSEYLVDVPLGNITL